ncbi:PTS sugar transporter subunit IIA [Enorma phocaeensis]|uniref:PTS sugar transporter subunit IIA n=1 Tax=Enorma phocaeensis TaxID=1871019 RepID=UPI00195C876B|nr:PTS glucose transporter subunit IIA [Enorma phocaeensis]MBM6952433.1 PTS glucose transporter subunit IIA [Enorma phocaeensis]
MKLWDKIKGTVTPDSGVETPQAASFATRPDTIYSPVSGILMRLEEINDEVLSAHLFGEGYGILPTSRTLYAPANGRIAATTVTNHSIGMLTDDGEEIIMHIGLGTVNMNGKGFTCFVNQGDVVKAGTPLIAFEPEAISSAGYEDVVTLIISNVGDSVRVNHIGSSGTLLGGRPLVKVGDPLLVVRK